MIIDKITLKDLSIFSQSKDGVFDLINFTETNWGRESLIKMIHQPAKNYNDLIERQALISHLCSTTDFWPKSLSNGTFVMVDSFFDAKDLSLNTPTGFNALLSDNFQKLFNKKAYNLTQFSISHLIDFIKACYHFVDFLEDNYLPNLLLSILRKIKNELDGNKLFKLISNIDHSISFHQLTTLQLKIKRQLKNPIFRLLEIVGELDAYNSLAVATQKHNWTFPKIVNEEDIRFEVKNLFHPLLKQPVTYDLKLQNKQHLLLLTGANMSGKTTLMRAVGIAVLLAHIGMGIPTQNCTLSFFSGIITNMHVEDNIQLGESYFFAEVKRMKETAEKMKKSPNQLVLMDELFKGTNVHDAMQCTKSVAEKLLFQNQHLIILSTHLYEVAESMIEQPEFQFKYFEIQSSGESQFAFTYQLKNGISKDKIGFSILEKMGVLELLNK